VRPGTCKINQIDVDIIRCVDVGKCTGAGCRFKVIKPKELELGEVIEMKVKPF
jgi:hypothetical protein